MQKKLSIQSQNYYSEDFKNLYRYIKTLNLLNQLYLSQALNQQQFEEEEKDTLSRYHKIKNALKGTDFQRFCELYGVEAEYKRIESEPKNEEQKKIIQVAVLLTSKIVELYDTLHQSNTVMNLINIVIEIDMLLQKLRKSSKNISADFIKCMDKITTIKQNMKKKTIHQDLSSIQAFQLQDTTTKLKIHFEEFFSR